MIFITKIYCSYITILWGRIREIQYTSLGLSSDGEPDVSDYRRSNMDVHTEFVVTVLGSTSSLEILEFCLLDIKSTLKDMRS
jgi:hypothetical protein